jgi:hypothetical protein
LYSVMTPAGVMRPSTELEPSTARSTNQTLPSGPAAIDVAGEVSGPNSVAILVVGLNMPIRVPVYSVNQRLPSGPVVIAYACEPGVMPVQTVRTKLLPAPGGVDVQVSTPVGPFVTVGHVVVV